MVVEVCTKLDPSPSPSPSLFVSTLIVVFHIVISPPISPFLDIKQKEGGFKEDIDTDLRCDGNRRNRCKEDDEVHEANEATFDDTSDGCGPMEIESDVSRPIDKKPSASATVSIVLADTENFQSKADINVDNKVNSTSHNKVGSKTAANKRKYSVSMRARRLSIRSFGPKPHTHERTFQILPELCLRLGRREWYYFFLVVPSLLDRLKAAVLASEARGLLWQLSRASTMSKPTVPTVLPTVLSSNPAEPLSLSLAATNSLYDGASSAPSSFGVSAILHEANSESVPCSNLSLNVTSDVLFLYTQPRSTHKHKNAFSPTAFSPTAFSPMEDCLAVAEKDIPEDDDKSLNNNNKNTTENACYGNEGFSDGIEGARGIRVVRYSRFSTLGVQLPSLPLLLQAFTPSQARDNLDSERMVCMCHCLYLIVLS